VVGPAVVGTPSNKALQLTPHRSALSIFGVFWRPKRALRAGVEGAARVN